jgi:hypothetical protein
MTINLGNELFAIGIKNRLVLFDHGCHIKTKEHNVFVKWEEIGRLFTYGHKQSLNGFTHTQKLGLSFELKDGRIIQIEFKLYAFLWGAEFLYHNHRTKKIFEVVAQHGIPIR